MFLLKDYTPSSYNIQQTQLSFLLGLDQTVVRTQLLLSLSAQGASELNHNLKHTQSLAILNLNGEDLELLDIKIAPYTSFEGQNNWKDWVNLNNLGELNHLNQLELDKSLGFENKNFISLVKDVDYVLEGNLGHLLKIHPKSLEKYLNLNTGLDLNQKFILQIENKIQPSANKTLMGMYASNGKIFTQCEAEGFRRITYYLDRPDQMSIFTVHIAAPAELPILLSNGNLLASWKNDASSTYINHSIWHDPFKKPSYLFALVAGDLKCLERKIKQNHQEKLLQIWVEPNDINKIEHAMNSLEKSIAWDAATYNLPLDLDRFMIVATHDFNVGAMENKGLNIFNAKYILAHPDMAVDVDYYNVESIIAHEYFHNWTGNRVTCRDWFQLTLKEGLTVFRDQSFSEDLQGQVTRLEGIQFLKQTQFAEDRGPMAHPIQPQFYEEINNFYTLTVYEKGAEIIRMYQTLLGKAGFMAGMKLYFERHDGQAVTCQDFLAAMRDANPDALNDAQWQAFAAWYTQKGTPLLHCIDDYDAQTGQLQIDISQRIQDIQQQEVELTMPLCIPIAVDIYVKTEDGVRRLSHADILKALNNNINNNINSNSIKLVDERCLLLLNQFSQDWRFDLSKLNLSNIQSIHISYLQDFSAPVLLDIEKLEKLEG